MKFVEGLLTGWAGGLLTAGVVLWLLRVWRWRRRFNELLRIVGAGRKQHELGRTLWRDLWRQDK